MWYLVGGKGRPAFTVFISPQAGKAFEVLFKRHSISRLIICLQYFILLLVGQSCPVVLSGRSSKSEARSLKRSRIIKNQCLSQSMGFLARLMVIRKIEPPLVCQNHRRVDLAVGDGPVCLEQLRFFLGSDPSKAVLLIEANRPNSIRPGTHQRRASELPAKLR